MLNFWILQNRLNGNGEVIVHNVGTIPCKPNLIYNIRPIMTVRGKVIEWQYMLTNTGLDLANIAITRPQPGQPIIEKMVIRFHPDDVSLF